MPEWYLFKPVAEWLGISVPAVSDTPMWWITRAVLALQAEHAAAKEQSGPIASTNAAIARIHGGG